MVPAAAEPVAEPEPPAPKPSVLFLAIDDLNDWAGCLGGYPGISTPAIDRLAGQGRLFSHAYCSAPACDPSRSSLLTGLAPWTLGIYDNTVDFRTAHPDVLTLPQYLALHGYRTVGGGKIFHNNFPDVRSWQEHFPTPSAPPPAGRPLNRLLTPHEFRQAKGLDRLLDWGPVDVPPEETSDGQLATWAEERLARDEAEGDDRPLFFAVGFARPHLPWYVPRQYFDAYPLAEVRLPEVLAGDLDDVPEIARQLAGGETLTAIYDPEVARRAVQAYLAAATFVDEQVGRVLAAWEASRHAAHGLVVLWSDHGFHLGEKGHWRKTTLWEEANHVPLIIRGAAVTRPGTPCRRPASLLDLYPTLVELCGLPPHPDLEGVSLAPWLADPTAPRERPAVTALVPGSFAARDERFRYIRYGDGSEELYDHEADPHEWTNVAARRDLGPVKQGLARFLPE